MRVSIESKHNDLSDELRSYLNEKIGKLDHYFNKIVATEVYLHNNNGNHEVEVKLIVPEDTLFVREVGVSFTAAVDIAFDTMKNTLKRYKSRTLHRSQYRPTDNI
jgi:putative sigma-54 modulation protein